MEDAAWSPNPAHKRLSLTEGRSCTVMANCEHPFPEPFQTPPGNIGNPFSRLDQLVEVTSKSELLIRPLMKITESWIITASS
jgi:hypothetical protein